MLRRAVYSASGDLLDSLDATLVEDRDALISWAGHADWWPEGADHELAWLAADVPGEGEFTIGVAGRVIAHLGRAEAVS